MSQSPRELALAYSAQFDGDNQEFAYEDFLAGWDAHREVSGSQIASIQVVAFNIMPPEMYDEFCRKVNPPLINPRERS